MRGLFGPPEPGREDSQPATESVVKSGRVVFFIPLLVMACVLGNCFDYPISILVMAGVLAICGVVAWFVLRSIRRSDQATAVYLDEEKPGLPPGTLLWIAYLLIVVIGTALALAAWGRGTGNTRPQSKDQPTPAEKVPPSR